MIPCGFLGDRIMQLGLKTPLCLHTLQLSANMQKRDSSDIITLRVQFIGPERACLQNSTRSRLCFGVNNGSFWGEVNRNLIRWRTLSMVWRDMLSIACESDISDFARFCEASLGFSTVAWWTVSMTSGVILLGLPAFLGPGHALP
jgi:hypothetical protein